MNRLRALAEDESGSTLPLAIFFVFLGLVVTLAVAGATSLYLERERLFTLADGAALAGAEAFDLADVAVADGVAHPSLSDERVAAAVRDYLAVVGDSGLEQVTVEKAGTDDGSTATIALSAWWRPPVLSVLLPAGIRLDVTSTARSVFW